MIYTKDQIIELVKKILEDLNLDYFKNKDFTVFFKDKVEGGFEEQFNFEKPWNCYVKTQDWQFDTEEGIYSFIIDNEISNKILFIDGSGGQVPHSFIKKDTEGKYFREYVDRSEG